MVPVWIIPIRLKELDCQFPINTKQGSTLGYLSLPIFMCVIAQRGLWI